MYMRLIITFIILALFSQTLYALTPVQRDHLLARVKKTKEGERKALHRHISRFKQSKNIRKRTLTNHRINAKYKKRLQRQLKRSRLRQQRAP